MTTNNYKDGQKVNKLRKLSLLLSVAGLCASSNVRAEMASGTYSNSFQNGVRIWDVSGTYNGGLEGVGLNYTINMDNTGKFAGHGAADVSGFVNMDLSFWGAIKTVSSNVAKMTLSMRFKGTVDAGGTAMAFSGLFKENLEVDADTSTLVGTVGGSVHVSVPELHRSVTQRIPVTDVQTPLPPGMTGNWNLTLNISTNSAHYLGDGEVTLSNGRMVPLTVTGAYGARTDASRLLLKSTGTNGLVNLGLSAVVENGQLHIQKLTGKALGQALKAQQP